MAVQYKYRRLPNGQVVATAVGNKQTTSNKTTSSSGSTKSSTGMTRGITASSVSSAPSTSTTATTNNNLKGMVANAIPVGSASAVANATPAQTNPNEKPYTWDEVKATHNYIDDYNNYAGKIGNLRDAYVLQAQRNHENNLAEQNNIYNTSARNNYITYRQNQKNLAGELNSLGIRGGASESAAVRLGNAYGANVATNDAARQAAIGSLQQNYENNINQYNQDIDARLAEAYQTAQDNQRRYDDEIRDINYNREQDAYNRWKAEEADTYQRQQDAYQREQDELARITAERQREEDLQREREAQEYERQKYEEQVLREQKAAEEAAAKEANEKYLEQYKASTLKYRTEDSVKAAIKKLKKSDPNYTAKKLALETRLGEIREAGGGSSGSGGGGGYSRSGGSSARNSYSGGGSGDTTQPTTASNGTSLSYEQRGGTVSNPNSVMYYSTGNGGNNAKKKTALNRTQNNSQYK